MNKSSELSLKDKIGISLLIFGIFYLIIMAYIAFTIPSVWWDEVFTIAIVQAPIKDMISLGSLDVHPLLYYFIFKIIARLFNYNNIIFIGKFVSMIPYFILTIFAITKFRKEFDWLTTGIFVLCLASMPQLMLYGTMMRMYSWALLFVTLSVYYAYKLIKNPSYKNLIIFTILSIASCYTHYFSAVATVIIYLIILVYSIKSNKTLIKKWLISVFIGIISYLPWLIILYGQLSSVHNDFWIPNITFQSIITYIYFVVSPNTALLKGPETLEPSILGSIFLIALIALIIYSLYKKLDNLKFSIFSISIIILSTVVGIIVSLIFKPVFIYRYTVPMLGAFYLGVAVLLSSTFNINKKIFYPILAIILIIGLISTANFIEIQDQEYPTFYNERQLYRNLITVDSVCIHEKVSIYVKFKFAYTPYCEHILLQDNFVDSIIDLINNPEYKNKPIYYIEYSKNTTDLLIDSGVNLTHIMGHVYRIEH